MVQKILQLLLLIPMTLASTLLPSFSVAAQEFQPLVRPAEQATPIDVLKCNTDEVKRGKRVGWTDVVFGAEINDGDYLNFIVAVGNSINDRDADALVTFFQNQTDELIDKIGPKVEQLGKRAIADLVTRVFFDRGSAQHVLEGGLELEAGIARINCRLEVSYPEPRSYQCKQYFGPFCPTCWTWSVCITTETVTKGFDYFPKYLPYVRYRANKNLPQFPLGAITQLVQSIQSNLQNLQALDKKLREELAQSEAEIQQRLKQETREIIALELGAAIERNIPVIPRHKFLPLLREIVARVLDRRGFSTVSLEIILNQLISDLNGLLKEVITEFNARIAETISTSPGSLVLDWASSNRTEKRAEIIGDGTWHVVWGVNVDDVEQGRLAAAIASAIPTGGASLAEYFSTYLERTVTKIQQQAPEIGRKLLLELVAKALTERGKVFGHLNMEVRAGIARYDRWADFPYPKIDVRRCSVNILGKNYEYACELTATKGTQEINLPYHYQPYIMFRFTNGKSAKPTGSNPTEGQTYYPGAGDDYYFGCKGDLDAVYVNRSTTSASDGSATHPFRTVMAATDCVKNGGELLISPDVYEEALIINKPMTLRSLNGVTTIKSPLATTDAQPLLTFDTSTVSFEVTLGDSNPEPVSAAIGRSGSGILTWNASSSQSWLTISPNSGAAPATIQISIDISALGVGQHTGEISISAGSQVIKRLVNVTITEKSVDAVLNPTSTTLSIEAPKSTGTSASQGITLTSSSATNLDWTASTSVSWLVPSADSGTTPSVVNVWANLDGLPVGTHTAALVIVTNSRSITVPVTVTIGVATGQVFLPLVRR